VPYVENGIADATNVRYLIRHAEGETEVIVDQTVVLNSWVDLGTYYFDPGLRPFVGLAAIDDKPGTNVWYDAMLWLPQ
jgi:hypothetical protein